MGKITLENRTRTTFRLPRKRAAPDAKPVRNRPEAAETDPAEDLVLGDRANGDLPEGAKHGPRCPSPTVDLQEEDLDKLTPHSRRVLESLVERGDVRLYRQAA